MQKYVKLLTQNQRSRWPCRHLACELLPVLRSVCVAGMAREIPYWSYCGRTRDCMAPTPVMTCAPEINISTECLKWRLMLRQIKYQPEHEMTSDAPTARIYVTSLRTTSFGPIRRLNMWCFAGYTNKQCLTKHVFAQLMEHRTSFQVFCRYVKC